MPNLLTPENKKRMKREYISRVLATFLFLLFVTTILSSVFLLPSYLLARSKQQGAERELVFLQDIIRQRESGGAPDEIRESESQLRRINSVFFSKKPTDVISVLVSTLPTGVSVTSVQYEKVLNEDYVGEVRITGIASSREDLLDFTKRLERERLFANVDLPVSSLANRENILFSLVFDVVARDSTR